MNETIREIFYLKLGSTWLLDTIYLYIIGPLAFVGFVLNYFSYSAFHKIRFRNVALKKYLEVYTISCFILCFILMFCVLFRTPRYFNLQQNYFASIYNCKVIVCVAITIFLFINILDSILLLERLSNFDFNSKLRRFFKFNPYKVCFLLYILSNLINISGFFVYEIKSNEDFESIQYDYEKLNTFVYCKRIPFFYTKTGKIIILITILIKHIFTLLIEMILSVCSIIKFKKYYKNTNSRLNRINNKMERNNLMIENNIAINSSKKSHLIMKSSKYSKSIQNSIRILNKIEIYNAGLTKMTIYLSIFSIINHIGLFFAYITIMIDEYNTKLHRYSGLLIILFVILKYTSNFFLFYHFNKSFRNYFRLI